MGWNRSYDFSVEDFISGLKQAAEILVGENVRDWARAALYIAADIVYGGRVTDGTDKQTLTALITPLIFGSPFEIECKAIFSTLPRDDADLSSLNSVELYIKDKLQRHLESTKVSTSDKEYAIFGMNSVAVAARALQKSKEFFKALDSTTGVDNELGIRSTVWEDNACIMAKKLLSDLPNAEAAKSKLAALRNETRKEDIGRRSSTKRRFFMKRAASEFRSVESLLIFTDFKHN